MPGRLCAMSDRTLRRYQPQCIPFNHLSFPFFFFFFFHFNWTEIRWNENQGRGVQRKRKFRKQWTKTTERKNKFSYQSELSSRKIIHTICYYLLYAMKFPKRHFLIKQNIANADRPPWHRHSESAAWAGLASLSGTGSIYSHLRVSLESPSPKARCRLHF